ncbi:hypothetical protein KGF86_01750 [Ornithinibacillus massiliensis]|uniref:Restriction endonuclease subunit S n=1 Tax=Ornithinibacillus massiliensis TaxID=1944633 RepID=A0ABS5MA05_9BACI|nr:hypothetical protein [Ornithinibacillus massiliensis]MBS3678928.1 hypothetical protein [Ornithinibacillus massiliensis]
MVRVIPDLPFSGKEFEKQKEYVLQEIARLSANAAEIEKQKKLLKIKYYK